MYVKRLNQHDSGTFTYLYIVLLDYVRTIYMSWDLDVKIIRIKFSVRLRDGLLEALISLVLGSATHVDMRSFFWVRRNKTNKQTKHMDSV